MKVARVLAAVALFFLPIAQAGAAPPDVAAAHKKLESALANLASAVQKIEVDPPSTADLEAAHEAVGVLKDAIDAGAEFETKDLDYAKAVLAARKELRAKREYVDVRRANVKIHEHRRQIDSAQTNLNDRAAKTEAKDANSKDYEEARAAADALKKAVDEARPFVKDDPKFGTFLAEVEANIAKQRKGMDDRATALFADKQLALVEESRQALATATAGLSKEATDAQFQAAEAALSGLTKRLDEGKVYESKDKAYRAGSDLARKDLAAAKKRMDELWSETGLARLKTEIEPAHKDLIAAGKALKARKPTPDQLAEARTAAIVVRSLYDKFQSAGSHSPPIGQYLGEVKATLVEVEVVLETRTLDVAKADVSQALKVLAGRTPTDDNFAEANTAVTVLEKTLETVHTKDPAMSAAVGDARSMIRDSKASIAKRRMEVDIQRQKTKVEEAKKIANDVLRQMNQPNAGADRVSEAESAVKLVRSMLDEGAPMTKKDREYAAYDKETKDKIKDFNERIASRKAALSASDGRTVLTEGVTTLKAKLEAARLPEATDADVGAAIKSLEALGKTIDGQTPLEKTDKGYAAHAERARNDFMRFADAVELAKQTRELRKQTTEVLTAGRTAADAGAGTQSLRGKKEQFEKATAQFKSCSSAGGSMLRENPALEKVALYFDGKKSTPKEVIALCVQRAEAADQQLKQVVPLIAFDEGPKKSFEKGKALLADSKEGDALKQFDDCISSGLILQNRSPGLKEVKFDVAGGSTTLPELIQTCIKQRKTLKK